MNYRYRIALRPLAGEKGGGWFAEVPELPGVRSDGDTPQQALDNVMDAIACWVEAAEEDGRASAVADRGRCDVSGQDAASKRLRQSGLFQDGVGERLVVDVRRHREGSSRDRAIPDFVAALSLPFEAAA